MTTSAYVALLLLLFVAAFYGVVYGSQRFFLVHRLLPWFRWLLSLLRITVEHWGLSKHYARTTDVALRSLMLAEALAVKGKGYRQARKELRVLVRDLHAVLHPGHAPDRLDMDVSVAAYMFLISHDDILAIILSIQLGHGDLEVKKATNLAIDVLGEIVARDTKLSRQYFQHLIYGINKALMLIKTKGTDKRTLKKVTSTLFRVYKLTKAYRHRRGLKNLTEVELYEKVVSLFGTMHKLSSE